jgi:hypothetical protein
MSSKKDASIAISSIAISWIAISSGAAGAAAAGASVASVATCECERDEHISKGEHPPVSSAVGAARV